MDAIEDIVVALSWPETVCLLGGTWLIYIAGLVMYRLWLSPLAHVPGPKLAALTEFYEFYYEFALRGQYTSKINELHAIYGPIVRINPWEVHVEDPDVFSEFYKEPNRHQDQWNSYTQQFCASQSGLATTDRSLPKLRRSALNTLPSAQTMLRTQPVIEERVDALLKAFLNYANLSNGQPLDVMYPFSAFTNDVINQYAFARSDHLVEKSDFGCEVTNDLLTDNHTSPLTKHVDWVFTLVNALPDSVSNQCAPKWGGFLKMKNDIIDHIRHLEESQSIGNWMLNANNSNFYRLSPKVGYSRDKASTRLAQESRTLVRGGTLITSWAMSLATFHLLDRPSTLRKLRDELFKAIPDPDGVIPLTRLERLPYLRGVVKEALRLGIGTSSQLARAASDEALIYHDYENDKQWHLPSGSVVGMSPYKTVMDESIFQDAKGFHPERWLEDGQRLDKYLTIFYAGSRVPLGMSLAHAELLLMLAKLFRSWGSGGVVHGSDEGDRRQGDLGYLSIYETRVRDCDMAIDCSMPIPYKGSEGLRFVFETY